MGQKYLLPVYNLVIGLLDLSQCAVHGSSYFLTIPPTYNMVVRILLNHSLVWADFGIYFDQNTSFLIHICQVFFGHPFFP